MKFKVDENLPVECTQVLCRAGFDAVTAAEQKLSGADDTVLAKHCSQENRILVTLDLDFANIQAYPPKLHSGIVVLRPNSQEKPRLLALLSRLLAVLRERSPEQQLWIVEENRIRYRED